MGENWAQAADSGSHWGRPDLRGSPEGRKSPASEFPAAEAHGFLAGVRKAQRGQGLQLRSPSPLRAKLKIEGFPRAAERMCPSAPLGSHASAATDDLSVSFPFREPQPSQLSRGDIRIPTGQTKLKQPAECPAKSQGPGVTGCPLGPQSPRQLPPSVVCSFDCCVCGRK